MAQKDWVLNMSSLPKQILREFGVHPVCPSRDSSNCTCALVVGTLFFLLVKMYAHVSNLQGPSVILVPSQYFQVQSLPRSLGLSCLTAPSQPDQMVPSAHITFC